MGDAGRVVVAAAIPAMDPLEYRRYFLLTWGWWCHRRGIPLFVIEQPLRLDMTPPWQRYYAFRMLERAGVPCEKLATVDVDTMIHWDCPDFFALAGKGVSGAIDCDRLDVIAALGARFGRLFPGVSVDLCNQLNSGMLVTSDAHRGVFDRMLDFFDNTLGPLADEIEYMSDQCPLNFVLERDRVPITRLSKRFNLTHLESKRCLDDLGFVALGSVWHFNGLDPEQRVRHMSRTWEAVALHYPDAEAMLADGKLYRTLEGDAALLV